MTTWPHITFFSAYIHMVGNNNINIESFKNYTRN